jgi:hypothetical protein
MRMSRVLLAGVAVAGAVATTSAFTASNTFTPGAGALDDNAGFAEMTVTGVAVSNVAYNPLAGDASKLDSVVFTVAEDTTDMKALLTVSTAGGPIASGAITCGAWTATLITCDVPDTVNIQDVTKIGFTVVSK